MGKSRRPKPKLELRIAAHRVGIYVPADGLSSSYDLSPLKTPTGYLTILSGPLSDFLQYSLSDDSEWLLDIANDLCDPQGRRGRLRMVQDPETNALGVVKADDPLEAAIYEYDPLSFPGLIPLSRINLRRGESLPDGTTGPSFRTLVLDRDASRCWVSRASRVLATRIVPRRLGEDIARRILEDFCGRPQSDPPTSMSSPIFGVTLSLNLAAMFRAYDFGLRHNEGTDTYNVHVFHDDEPGTFASIAGQTSLIHFHLPRLHGQMAASPDVHAVDLPLPGLFRWHYLQCVIRKFATEQYKSLPNIHYINLSVPMDKRVGGYPSDEESESDSDSETDGDWPSAAMDQGRAVAFAQASSNACMSRTGTWVDIVS